MKVLLVEDNKHLQFHINHMLYHFLGEDTHVLIAGNLHDAKNTFLDHSDSLDLILMDLNLGRGEVTFSLIQEISGVYQGPMVAISSNVNEHHEMLKHGCTHACEKMDLLGFITEKKFKKPYLTP